ncbi:hypothetical protein Q1695_003612 [Nippostrongylus brasiliensis]|nr:hypothetical protein Q1695_003612 [Nippostrongylus brasiliensis]
MHAPDHTRLHLNLLNVGGMSKQSQKHIEPAGYRQLHDTCVCVTVPSNAVHHYSCSRRRLLDGGHSKEEEKEELKLSAVTTIGMGATEPHPDVFNAPLPSIQNIVATVDLGRRIDLKKLTLHSRNTEYNPKRFSAVIMRIREPRTTALIFSSGKMVTTGAKSESASRQASRKFARIVQKVGFNVKFADFKVQNIVGSCDVRFSIRLEGLCIMHAQFSTYEPELFPGLIYRMVHPRVVLLIFVSGKVVITGARHQDDIDQAFHHIYPILRRFKK